MSCILNIETSTNVCSVAVSQDGLCVFKKADCSGPNHAVALGVFVDEALSYIDSRDMPLDAVAVSCGPGSYTGLRIGVSMAKGICYGRGVKLIAVPTLELLSVPVLLEHELEDGTLLCPMLDARRMEVYAGIYDRALREVRGVQADVVDGDTYKEFLELFKQFEHHATIMFYRVCLFRIVHRLWLFHYIFSLVYVNRIIYVKLEIAHYRQMVPQLLTAVAVVLRLRKHPFHYTDNGFCAFLTLIPVAKRHGIINHFLHLAPVLRQYELFTVGIIVKSFDIHYYNKW